MPALLALGLLGACHSGGEPNAEGLGEDAGLGAIGFYQRWLGPQWGPHCAFEPSCSQFAAEAISSHGLLTGLALTTNRLQRDHPYALEQYARAADGHPIDPVDEHWPFPDEDDVDEPAPRPQEDLGPRPGTPSELFEFARALRTRGALDDAAVELERHLHLYPDDPDRVQVRELLCITRAEQGRTQEAFEIAAPLPSERRDGLRAVALAENERFDAARLLIPQGDEEGRVLGGLFALEAGRPDPARHSFDTLADPLRSMGLEATTSWEQARHRSPTAAGFFSAVLPGSGQLYAGQTADGLVAFLLNATFLGGTYAAIRQEENVAAVALGFVALGFYSGNVYGAVDAAHRFNRAEHEDVVRTLQGRLRQHFLDEGHRGSAEHTLLGFYLRF